MKTLPDCYYSLVETIFHLHTHCLPGTIQNSSSLLSLLLDSQRNTTADLINLLDYLEGNKVSSPGAHVLFLTYQVFCGCVLAVASCGCFFQVSFVFGHFCGCILRLLLPSLLCLRTLLRLLLATASPKSLLPSGSSAVASCDCFSQVSSAFGLFCGCFLRLRLPSPLCLRALRLHLAASSSSSLPLGSAAASCGFIFLVSAFGLWAASCGFVFFVSVFGLCGCILRLRLLRLCLRALLWLLLATASP